MYSGGNSAHGGFLHMFTKNKTILLISSVATTLSFFIYTFIFRNNKTTKSIDSKPSQSTTSVSTTVATTTKEEAVATTTTTTTQNNENIKSQTTQTSSSQSDIIKPNTTTSTTKTKDKLPIKRIIVNDPIQLPYSLLISILESLSFKDIQRFKSVNKNWNKILCKLDKIWQRFIIDKWGFDSLPMPKSDKELVEYANFFKLKYIEERKRLGFKPEQFIISVHEQCADFTDPATWKMERVFSADEWWRKRLLEELQCLTMSRLQLTEKGQATGSIVSVNKNQVVGTFRFINTYDARAKFESYKFLELSNDSPFTGETVGYFSFSLSTLDSDENLSLNAEFLRLITFQTRGIITNIVNQASARSALLETCKLKHVFGKGGMNDGDCLLDTELTSTYIVSLIEDIQKFLDRKGVGYNSVEGGTKVVFVDQTSHNPIRFTGHLPKEALTLELPIWIYNSVILSNKKLWGRSLDN